MTPDPEVVAWARATARRYAGRRAGGVEVLRERPSVVVAAGGVVVKVHEPGTDPVALGGRLRAAVELGGEGLLLAPLEAGPVPVPVGGGTLRASVWPRVEVLAHRPETIPWAVVGALVARLHEREPLPALPGHGAPGRLRRDLDAMAAAVRLLDGAGCQDFGIGRAVDVVAAARSTLAAAVWTPAPPSRPVRTVHGDLHLGQLGRPAARGRPGGRPPAHGWVLIDVDDLGLGDPVWDLARPAAFWACGLLADVAWRSFLGGYRSQSPATADALGLGTAAEDDPWPVLEPVARACTVQTAAAGVRRAAEGVAAGHGTGTAGGLDDADRRLLGACARMAEGR